MKITPLSKVMRVLINCNGCIQYNLIGVTDIDIDSILRSYGISLQDLLDEGFTIHNLHVQINQPNEATAQCGNKNMAEPKVYMQPHFDFIQEDMFQDDHFEYPYKMRILCSFCKQLKAANKEISKLKSK